MDTAANWLDIMPAIPLARGVPAISIGHRVTAITVGVVNGAPLLACPGAMDDSPADLRSWRVDLGDPQGFSYALDQLYQQGRARKGREYLTQFSSLNYRARLGRTTDADRLALARALAEVTR